MRKAFLNHIFFNKGISKSCIERLIVLIFISIFFGSSLIVFIPSSMNEVFSFSHCVIESTYFGFFFADLISICNWFLSTILLVGSCWISESINLGLLCIILISDIFDTEFFFGVYWIPVSTTCCLVFDWRIFMHELFFEICGFHGLIHILSLWFNDIGEIISNFDFVILFSIFSCWIPVSTKSFFFCNILYSFVLPMIFSILTYCVHSSTFSGFFGMIIISFLILDISLLFLFILIPSTWQLSSFFGIFEIISSFDFVIWLSGYSCWISVSTNSGFFGIILICSFLSILFSIFIDWEPSSIFLVLIFIILISLFIFDITGFHCFPSFILSSFDILDIIISIFEWVILFSSGLYCTPVSVNSGFIFIILISLFLIFSIFVSHEPICIPNSSFLIFDKIFNLSFVIIIFSFLFLSISFCFPLYETERFSVINNLSNLFFLFSSLFVWINISFFSVIFWTEKSFFSFDFCFIWISFAAWISYVVSLFFIFLILSLNFSKIFLKMLFLWYSTIFITCFKLSNLFLFFIFS